MNYKFVLITYMNSIVAELNLSNWGRKDIKLSEIEMPGLMKLREQYNKIFNRDTYHKSSTCS